MLLRPPIFTLFPYTTLFRSLPEYRHFFIALGIIRNGLNWNAVDGFPVKIVFLIGGPDEKQTEYLDRKSTRLNSSHANISYAVFCLKKKNDSRTHPRHHHQPC